MNSKYVFIEVVSSGVAPQYNCTIGEYTIRTWICSSSYDKLRGKDFSELSESKVNADIKKNNKFMSKDFMTGIVNSVAATNDVELYPLHDYGVDNNDYFLAFQCKN